MIVHIQFYTSQENYKTLSLCSWGYIWFIRKCTYLSTSEQRSGPTIFQQHVCYIKYKE